MSASTTNGLILQTADGALTYGPKYVPVYDLPSNPAYTKALVEGHQSLYVVYAQPKMATAQFGESPGVVVDKESFTSLGIHVRSFQGFDKDGLILFEHSNYAGNGVNYRQSDPNIDNEFPAGKPAGVSSFIINKGIWELYVNPDFKGGKVTLDGTSQFGPGTKISFVGVSINDSIRSVKKVQD